MSARLPLTGERIIVASLRINVARGRVDSIRSLVAHGLRRDAQVFLPDRFTFSDALKTLLIQYMLNNEQKNIATLLSALDNVDFENDPDICQRTLGIHRSVVCRIFAQAIIETSGSMGSDEQSVSFRAITLACLMRNLRRVNNPSWYYRIARYCERAFRQLHVKVPEDFYSALRSQASDSGSYPHRAPHASRQPRKRRLSPSSELQGAASGAGPSGAGEPDLTSSESGSELYPWEKRAAIAPKGVTGPSAQAGTSGGNIQGNVAQSSDLCQARVQDHTSSESDPELYAGMERDAIRPSVARVSPLRGVQDPGLWHATESSTRTGTSRGDADEDGSKQGIDPPTAIRVKVLHQSRGQYEGGPPKKPRYAVPFRGVHVSPNQDEAGPSRQAGPSGSGAEQDASYPERRNIPMAREEENKVEATPRYSYVMVETPARAGAPGPPILKVIPYIAHHGVGSSRRAGTSRSSTEQDVNTEPGSEARLHPGMETHGNAGPSGQTGASVRSSQAYGDASQNRPSGLRDVDGRGDPAPSQGLVSGSERLQAEDDARIRSPSTGAVQVKVVHKSPGWSEKLPPRILQASRYFMPRTQDKTTPKRRSRRSSGGTERGETHLAIASDILYRIVQQLGSQEAAAPSGQAEASEINIPAQGDASEPGRRGLAAPHEQDSVRSQSTSELRPAAVTHASIRGVIPRRLFAHNSRIRNAAESRGHATESGSNTEEDASQHGPMGSGERDYTSSESGSELHPGMKRHANNSFIAASSLLGYSRVRDVAGSSGQAEESARKVEESEETRTQEQDSESTD